MKIFTKLILMLLVLFTSSMSFGQWSKIRNQLNPKFYQTSGITYMMGGSSTEAYIYSTTNDGTSWTTLSGVLLSAGTPYSFVVKDINTIVVGTSTGVRYKNGTIYTQSSLTYATKSVMYDGTNFWAGTSNGIYRSTNNGVNWSSFGGLSGSDIKYILKVETNLFAIAASLLKSDNNGYNWSVVDVPGGAVCMTYGNGTLWVAGGSVNRSINFGTNWITDDVLGPNYIPNSIVSNGMDVFIATVGLGCNVFHGYSQGSTYSYVKRNSGLPYTANLKSMVVGYNYLLAANDSAVWRCPLTYVTNVEKISTEMPTKYSLSQNYPNPFNPSTTIRYQIPKQGIVTLKIYDITGKEIETLVNELQSPGTYEVNWNAGKYSSGVYFYKIESENFTDTKRMLLVK